MLSDATLTALYPGETVKWTSASFAAHPLPSVFRHKGGLTVKSVVPDILGVVGNVATVSSDGHTVALEMALLNTIQQALEAVVVVVTLTARDATFGVDRELK
eukprot:PhM_4_TR18082/c1_g1_i7/m.102135